MTPTEAILFWDLEFAALVLAVYLPFWLKRRLTRQERPHEQTTISHIKLIHPPYDWSRDGE